MKNSRITADVHAAWVDMAKYFLRKGVCPASATHRDLEILANSRFRDECGAIWEQSSYVDGCPNCREKAEIAGEVLGNVKDSVYDASVDFAELKEAIDNLEFDLEEAKKRINYYLKHQ